MGADEFDKLSALDQDINFAHINQRLLDAAMFHETNRCRVENELPPLTHLTPLDDAAAMHARDMIARKYVGHVEKDNPDTRNPIDRVRKAGLDAMFVSENAALAYGIQYDPGRDVFPLSQWHREGLSYRGDGPAIPPHTYRSFAQTLVKMWMDSPAHRANILMRGSQSLGVACLEQPVKGKSVENEFHRFYCVQVFCTLKQRRAAPTTGPQRFDDQNEGD
ncbi:MAG: CAP domain-containing protein [Tepidisphaeraceae bacterium]